LSDFKQTRIFSTEFRKVFTYQISWGSLQWEPSCPCERANERTDRHTHPEANSRFRQFCQRD